MKALNLSLALFSTTLLLACGGGGGGGSTDGDGITDGGGSTDGGFTITTGATENGSISPQSLNVDSGESGAFTVIADTGYNVSAVSGCGGTLDGHTYTTGPIVSSCEITATFLLNRYEITTDAGNGGSITPSNAFVDHGSVAEFTLAPDSGFTIATVTGCNGDLIDNTYTTEALAAPCTVTAAFSTIAELLNGDYKGKMRSSKTFFLDDSVTLTFAIDGLDANLTKVAVFGRTCLLSGALSGAAFPLSGTGTFQCSDFTDGTWASSKIAKTNVTASLSEIEMTAGSDIYTIKVAGFRDDFIANYDSALDFWNKTANLEEFDDYFKGVMQSQGSCTTLTFSPSQTEFWITINGDAIALEQNAFFEDVCKYNGNIESFEDGVITASGTYECSNFDTGTWSTDRLVMTGGDSMFAELLVDVPARGCSYPVKYLGFK